MKATTSLIAALSLVLAFSSVGECKDKKKPAQRGMLESMQSVPCGAKERGLTGLGSVFGSVGVQHVDSNEKLCPQYLFRTDDMDYHIRPIDVKHAALLPVGHEAEYKIKKNRLFLKAEEGDKGDKKTRVYQVVAMQPTSPTSETNAEGAAYHPPPVQSRPPNEVGQNVTGQTPSSDRPPQPQ
jgi:hypothetical protein